MPLGLGKNRVTGMGLISVNLDTLPKGQVNAFLGRARRKGHGKTQRVNGSRDPEIKSDKEPATKALTGGVRG